MAPEATEVLRSRSCPSHCHIALDGPGSCPHRRGRRLKEGGATAPSRGEYFLPQMGTRLAGRRGSATELGHSETMVRLRVTHALSGSIDGIRLSDLRVGFVYDVGATLGCYLLCMDIWPESTFPPHSGGARAAHR